MLVGNYFWRSNLKPKQRLMSRIAFVLLLAMSCTLIRAQQIQFTDSGKLVALHIKEQKQVVKVRKFLPDKEKKVINLPDFDVQTLKDVSNSEKQQGREVLRKKVAETIKKIRQPQSGLNDLLIDIWGKGGRDSVLTDLDAFETYLKNENAVIANFNYLSLTAQSINKYLRKDAPNVFYIDNSKPLQQEFRKKVVFNHFLIDAYNATFAAAPESIKEMTLNRLLNYTAYLTKEKETAASLIEEASINNNVISGDLYREMINFLQRLYADSSVYSELRFMVRDPWFKQWFWLQGGQLRLNPLNFTTEEYLGRHPQYDLEKATIFNTYIDTVINRHIRYDSTGKVEEFKRLLALKGTGKDIFSLKERLDKMTAENDKRLQQLQKADKLLNKVVLPKSLAFYNFSAIDSFESQFNQPKYLTKPLRAEESKTLVVHNIPAGIEAKLKEDNTDIASRSEFQLATDTIVSQLVQVASFAVQFTPYAPLLAPKSVLARPGGDDPKAKDASYVEEDLQLELGASFEPGLFEYVKGEIKKVFLDADKILAAPVDAKSEAQRKLKNEFKKLYEEELKYALVQVKKENNTLKSLISIYSNSDLPPKELKIENDNQPLYHSKILITETSDKPIEKKVTVYTFKSTDTAQVATFKYKADRNHRYQLSAGIAYTFSDFVQSTAKEKDGTIEITNTAQEFRFVVGLHVHFGKGLYLHDNRFPGSFWERSSGFVGVGIPEPLQNIYLGYGYDLVPGLKTTIGVQLYRNNEYQIQNNKIIEERYRYKFTGPFVALQIDPSSLIKALGIFKN